MQKVNLDRWSLMAQGLGYPTVRAFLIKRYLLDSATAGILAHQLCCSRWTINTLMRELGIPRRGPKLNMLSPREVEYWQDELRKEHSDGHSARLVPDVEHAVQSGAPPNASELD